MEFSTVFGDGRDGRAPALCLEVKQHPLGSPPFPLLLAGVVLLSPCWVASLLPAAQAPAVPGWPASALISEPGRLRAGVSRLASGTPPSCYLGGEGLPRRKE